MARTTEENSKYLKQYRAANLERLRAFDRARYKADKAPLLRYHANKEVCQARARQWKLDNRDRRDASRREWYLQNRDWALEYARKYTAEHQEQRRQYNEKWRAENPDLVREIARLSRLKNSEKQRIYHANRRARHRGAEGRHTTKDVQEMYVTQDGRCAACNVEFPQAGKHRFHVDHIMPLKLGGSNWPENLQLLCRTCNLRKNAKHPDVWRSLRSASL